MIYDKAPLFEVGISIFTEENGLVDAYDVRALHDLYRNDFPNFERQLPIIPGNGSEPFPVEKADDDHHRWWFISEDRRDLLQVQSNFMGRNWRRNTLPGGELRGYAGFVALLSSLKQCWDARAADLTAGGHSVPQPKRAEVFYDNLLPLADGQRIRDLLDGVQLTGPTKLVGFNMGWVEALPQSATGQLQVEVRTVAASEGPNEEERRNFIRIRFVARDDVSSIDEAIALLTEAHETISERLHNLTTESCRAIWKAK